MTPKLWTQRLWRGVVEERCLCAEGGPRGLLECRQVSMLT